MSEYIFMAIVLAGASVLAAYARWDYWRSRRLAAAEAKRGA